MEIWTSMSFSLFLLFNSLWPLSFSFHSTDERWKCWCLLCFALFLFPWGLPVMLLYLLLYLIGDSGCYMPTGRNYNNPVHNKAYYFVPGKFNNISQLLTFEWIATNTGFEEIMLFLKITVMSLQTYMEKCPYICFHKDDWIIVLSNLAASLRFTNVRYPCIPCIVW